MAMLTKEEAREKLYAMLKAGCVLWRKSPWVAMPVQASKCLWELLISIVKRFALEMKLVLLSTMPACATDSHFAPSLGAAAQICDAAGCAAHGGPCTIANILHLARQAGARAGSPLLRPLPSSWQPACPVGVELLPHLWPHFQTPFCRLEHIAQLVWRRVGLPQLLTAPFLRIRLLYATTTVLHLCVCKCCSCVFSPPPTG